MTASTQLSRSRRGLRTAGIRYQRPYAVSSAIGCRAPLSVIRRNQLVWPGFPEADVRDPVQRAGGSASGRPHGAVVRPMVKV